MAAGYQLDVPTIDTQLGADAHEILRFYHWLKVRYAVLNQNLSVAILTTAPLSFSTADANAIMALVGDMNRLILVMEGTNPGSFTNIAGFDAPALCGVN